MRNKMNESDCECPRCGKSWHGMTLQSIFFKTNKKAFPNKTNNEIKELVKQQLKENGKTGQEHVTALIGVGGVWCCPKCGLSVTEKDVFRLVDNKNRRILSYIIGVQIRLKAYLRLKHHVNEWLVRRYMVLTKNPDKRLCNMRKWVLFTFIYLLDKNVRNPKA